MKTDMLERRELLGPRDMPKPRWNAASTRDAFLYTAVLLLAAVQLPSLLLASENEIRLVDSYTLRGDRNFLDGYAPLNEDGTINVVIEIPTGTTAKWEVAKPSGEIKWEFKDGKPRVVRYLGYPGNYGMIPRTLLPEESGGDGDPLDVIVLGPAVPRGTVVKARVIGVLKLLDGGERDDKIIAVLDRDPLAAVSSVAELQEEFPGVAEIVEIWFESYKGPGELDASGFDGPDVGRKVIDEAVTAFAR
jgi:inorganic pyrophosphatase